VFLEELDQILPRDAPVLAAGDPVALEAARVEPLAHRPWRDFTDFGDLACRENLHHKTPYGSFVSGNVLASPHRTRWNEAPPTRIDHDHRDDRVVVPHDGRLSAAGA